MNKSIELKDLASFKEAHDQNFKGAEKHAATNVGVLKASVDQEILRDNPNVFKTELKPGSITDQKKSGRCWMYASLNMLRVDMIKRWNLKDFTFSHGYLYFFDKLERANAYLENVIELKDKDLEDRLNHIVVFHAMEDGGWWSTFVRLVEKYGIVPDYAYQDPANVKKTDEFVELLSKRLKKGAKDIREAHKAGKSEEELVAIKDACMEDIFRMDAIAMGIPPRTFDLILRDKDDKLIEKRGMTPMEFYEEYVKEDLEQYVEIAHMPVEGKKLNTLYVRPYMKLPVEFEGIQYLSVSGERLKEITKKMIEGGTPVWFGADVGQESLIDDEGNGTLAEGVLNMDGMFRFDSTIDKGDALSLQHSTPTHAMVFQGFDEGENHLRWKVENSWGDKRGSKGYLVMDDKWFDRYVYEIVAKKSYLNDEEKKALEQEPITLMPWEF
ncbi:MAG: C1 family peptidase [Tissierellia bacterium]|nr:C1 family peptidase [Tissierellia bacterium]